ncbi:ParB/RepB/Spo0J family partition protein, partial [Devosia sp.]|uniref:ParB/RepB/Spo0J family partition protein n=1 Tax=Devosia sp. TaxID=1871048 RepID=UPI002EF2E689
FKIPDHVDEPEVTSDPQAEVKPALPRTGVGMLSRMLNGAAADTEAVSKLNAEIEKLKLQVGEQLIDPRQITLTRWADRHPDSFSSQAFAELKQEIESAGGNVQPIKVRPVRGAAAEQPEGPRFELVYGSRRTRACLELGLPVRAVVDENVDDQALYVQMQRENRGRSNLSAWEQGVSYHKALNEGLFPSARRLAEQIGLDHSNVAKALRVAELPQEIVGAFRSPVDIQFRWAVALDKAYQQDPDAVLSAARLLAGRSPKPAAAEVFRSLTEAVSAKGKAKAKEASRAFVIADGKKGVIRAGKGGAVTVELPRGVLPPARWAAFETALQKLISDLPEAP